MTKKVIFMKNELQEVYSDMPSSEGNPCLNCGACCAHFRISFYFGETQEHGGLVPTELTEKLNDFRVYMKGSWGQSPRCAALEGTPGTKISCKIYSQRPSVCRAYHVWDPKTGAPNPDCQKLREKIGLPLLAAAQ